MHISSKNFLPSFTNYVKKKFFFNKKKQNVTGQHPLRETKASTRVRDHRDHMNHSAAIRFPVAGPRVQNQRENWRGNVYLRVGSRREKKHISMRVFAHVIPAVYISLARFVVRFGEAVIARAHTLMSYSYEYGTVNKRMNCLHYHDICGAANRRNRGSHIRETVDLFNNNEP